jgi:hypothetical protein
MAQIFTTGPCELWCGVAGSQESPQPVFVGHGEKAPIAREIPNFKPVICDLGGDVEQFDAMFLRKHLIVEVDLIRENMAPLLAMRSRPNPWTGTLGINVVGDVGSLMLTEALAWPIWLRWPYSLQGAMFGLPNGIHAYNAYMIGPDDHTMGTVPYKFRAVFYCMDQYQSSGANVGGFNCYDGNMSALPNASVLYPPN